MNTLPENPYEMRAEIWRDYPLNPKYAISNLGRAKIKDRLRKDGRRLKGRLLELDKRGLYNIEIGGKRIMSPIKLVRQAFSLNSVDISPMPNEVWKEVEGYEDYKVSNIGRVASYKKQNKLVADIMIPQPKKSGHLNVVLRKNNKYKVFMVHRLVANAFIPNPELKEWINHINSNPADNRIENLEWVTARENRYHGKGISKYPCITLINGKYLVKIQHENKPNTIGRFDSLENAIIARNSFFKKNGITNKYL